ncbi:hypothetical protein [Dactylosporangium sp. CA-233914]|uniref:hypothetical protein n=1 Tax=Dactylosporangium sp. CA-233914 TaxID=3239934 RepID=UPI003D94F828
MSEHAVALTVLRRPGPRPPVWNRPVAAVAGADAAIAPWRSGLVQYLRRSSRAVGSAMARIRPADQAAAVPVLAPGPWDAPGSLTAAPAGWFTVAVDAGPDGFRLDGHTLDAGAFADAIWQCPRWRGRPVLLVTQPSAPDDGAGSVLRQLAVTLGAPVYASDRGLHFIFGRAVADRMFWCWRPGAESELPEPVGVVLPAPARPGTAQPAAAVTPPTDRATVTPAESTVDVAALTAILPLEVPAVDVAGFDFGVRQVAVAGLDLGSRRPSGIGADVEPLGRPAPAEPAPAEAGTAEPDAGATAAPAEPAWYPVVTGVHETDRERVRTALGWKFQAYSRVVSRAMSLHPGLRGVAGAHDGGVGLVAVLALLDGAGARVNAGLRGGGVPDEQVRALARCAAAGLAQLPAVTGPVFAAAPAGTDLTRLYRPGDVLVEPAFATVSVGRGGGTAPRYAIWSATARRLDQLRAPDESAGESRAMFPAGTRFEVLAVDPAGPGGTPCVLVRERVFDRRDDSLDQRLARKLRDALEALDTGPAASVTQPWLLGLAGERRFPLDTDPRARGHQEPTSAPEGAES